VLVACKNSQTPPFEAGQKRSVVSASRRPVGRPLRWGLLLRVCAPRSFACGRRAAQPRRGIGAGALSGLRTFFSSRGRLGACSAEAAYSSRWICKYQCREAAQSASTTAKSGADSDACAFQIPPRISAWPNTDKTHLLCPCPETGRETSPTPPGRTRREPGPPCPRGMKQGLASTERTEQAAVLPVASRS
jgi:hypothetical protein